MFTGNPGIKVDVPNDPKPIDIFKIFVEEEILNHIVNQTNIFARRFIDKQSDKDRTNARANRWKPVCLEELLNFLAVSLLMGLEKNPTIPSYWSTDDLFVQPIFHSVMGRNRYQDIHSFLYFNNNSKMLPKGHPEYDRIFKVRPVLDYFNKRFKDVYQPTQKLPLMNIYY